MLLTIILKYKVAQKAIGLPIFTCCSQCKVTFAPPCTLKFLKLVNTLQGIVWRKIFNEDFRMMLPRDSIGHFKV